METVVFIACAIICVVGALGVIIAKNPVHSALMLVATLFGVAVLFLAMDAQFLAAVQVIVYAGAIVVLFLFVIMLFGVYRSENLRVEPIAGQRPMAIAVGVATLALGVIIVAVATGGSPTGDEAVTAPALDSVTAHTQDATSVLRDNQSSGEEFLPNVRQLGRVIFTDYVWAFEITGVLLTIAVVGAIALSRRAQPGQAQQRRARRGASNNGAADSVATGGDVAGGDVAGDNAGGYEGTPLSEEPA